MDGEEVMWLEVIVRSPVAGVYNGTCLADRRAYPVFWVSGLRSDLGVLIDEGCGGVKGESKMTGSGD